MTDADRITELFSRAPDHYGPDCYAWWGEYYALKEELVERARLRSYPGWPPLCMGDCSRCGRAYAECEDGFIARDRP